MRTTLAQKLSGSRGRAGAHTGWTEVLRITRARPRSSQRVRPRRCLELSIHSAFTSLPIFSGCRDEKSDSFRGFGVRTRAATPKRSCFAGTEPSRASLGVSSATASPRRLRQCAKLLTPVLISFTGLYAVVLAVSPWPPLTLLKHVVAPHNCGAAREVGSASARAGERGYWEKNDRDRDGIACETWVRR